jgi:hypothetical protein
MRHWERARIAESCGGCGVPVVVGSPIQIVTLKGVSKRRIRCERCASTAVDLEQLAAFDAGITQAAEKLKRFEFTHVTRALEFDVKAAAAGDNE